MAQNLAMRQLDKRQTEHEVSSKMDICIAYSGSVYGQHPRQSAEEGRFCSALVWRPDGKLLTAGDSGGVMTIRHIESAVGIHSEHLDSGGAMAQDMRTLNMLVGPIEGGSEEGQLVIV